MKKADEAFTTSQVSVTTAASKIVSGADGRDSITIRNIGSATVYVGNSASVTSGTGFPINSGEALVMETTRDIYAIAASGTVTVALLEER